MNTTVNTLAHKAVLANLTLRRWGERKFDKPAAAEVLDNHKAERACGSFSKRLLNQKALEDLRVVWAAARSYHYEKTMPWFDKGPRVLPTVFYFDYAKRMGELKTQWDAAVHKFISGYPDWCTQAEKELGDLYNASDYPNVSVVEAAFGFEISFNEMPNGDFRTDLDPAVTKELKTNLHQQIESTYQNAMNSVAERVLDVVSHLSEKLKDFKPADKKKGTKAEGSFKDSLVGNVKELADLLPAFNLTNDPKLTALHKAIVDKLCAHEADDLREDQALRKQVAKDAKNILQQVEDFLA